MKNKKYFQLTQNENEVDIQIYGDITSWDWFEGEISSYTLSKLIEDLDCNKINVYINSYGGDVAEGLAIYNQLKRHKATVKTVCDGFACSAASVVFMAGDERVMSIASMLMIHNAWSSCSGNANELRKQADDLEKITQASINAYMQEVNITEDKLKELLDNETWLTPQEAIDMGFANCIVNEKNSKDINQSAKKSLINMVIKSKKDDKKKKCEETKKFKCSECEYIYEGEEPPQKCPECGSTEFIEITDDDENEENNNSQKNVESKPLDSFLNLMKRGE